MAFVSKKLHSGCCIYRIQNATNGKSYIGQTRNIVYRRNLHRTNLLNGTHPNKEMQHDFNNGDMLIMSALEYFPRNISSAILNAKEQAYIRVHRANMTVYNHRNAPKSDIICTTKTKKYQLSPEKIHRQIVRLNEKGGVPFSRVHDICIALRCGPDVENFIIS